MDPKLKNTFYLIFGIIVYLVAVYAILQRLTGLSDNVVVLFALALLPLLAVLVMVWGYGMKLKTPGLELEYYPVEKVMKPPVTITEDINGEEAGIVMEQKQNDFLNILDKNGLFKGIFTKADLLKAQKLGKLKNKVKTLMTQRGNIIHALEREDLKNIMKKIGETKHSRLPVLDRNNRLMGVVDSVDIHDLLVKMLK